MLSEKSVYIKIIFIGINIIILIKHNLNLIDITI